jgi:taurine transport system ATP-binding protein
VSRLSIIGVSVEFPAGTYSGPVKALENISLEMDAAEFVVILGASGCGKTTLLNLLAGFIAPTEGEVRLNQRTVTGPGADRSVVFQKHALFPWLNVIDNVAFGLKLRGVGKVDRYEVAHKYLRQLGLESFAHYPVYHLSGGMQQRVGIARALANDPEILLMDEPLGALDALTREKTQELILRIWRQSAKMVFFITHSVEEALFMGTRLVVMSPRPGRITHTFDIEFGRKFLESGDARAVKSSPGFIDLREKVLGVVLKDQEHVSDD